MKWIFGLLILFLMSSVAVSNHTPHRNRVSHQYNLRIVSNTYMEQGLTETILASWNRVPERSRDMMQAINNGR